MFRPLSFSQRTARWRWFNWPMWMKLLLLWWNCTTISWVKPAICECRFPKVPFNRFFWKIFEEEPKINFLKMKNCFSIFFCLMQLLSTHRNLYTVWEMTNEENLQSCLPVIFWFYSIRFLLRKRWFKVEKRNL